jgi:Holliday junction resolvase RusA-like endonuclease
MSYLDIAAGKPIPAAVVWDFEITVPGKPATQGSKQPYARMKTVTDVVNGVVVNRRMPVLRGDGSMVMGVKDHNERELKSWREQVASAAQRAFRCQPLMDGALQVELVFVRPRNKGHFGTGKNAGTLKGSAPAYPAIAPDDEKLSRAVSDALTGVVWTDDSRVVDRHIAKRYGDRFETIIRVRSAPMQTMDDLVAAGVVEPPAPAQVFGEFEQLSII